MRKFNLSEEVEKRQKFEEPLIEIDSKGKLKLTEPVFILRAQDISAPALVQAWIALNYDAPKEKLEGAQKILEAMREWPQKKKAD